MYFKLSFLYVQNITFKEAITKSSRVLSAFHLQVQFLSDFKDNRLVFFFNSNSL